MFRKNAVLNRRLGGARDDDAHDVTDRQRTFMTTPLMFSPVPRGTEFT